MKRLIASWSVALLLVTVDQLPGAAGAVSTVRVNVRTGEGQSNQGAGSAVVSRNGRRVAFESLSGNLVPGDTNKKYDIFVRDLARGTTRRVSMTSQGTERNGWAYGPDISADGHLVVFESDARLVKSDTNHWNDVYIHNLRTRNTKRISVNSSEQQLSEGGNYPAISANGRFVTFSSNGKGLLKKNINHSGDDIFLRDRKKGTTELISMSSGERQGRGHSHTSDVSANGRFVAFGSSASNLVPGDTNGLEDVFVRDRLKGQTVRVSVNSREQQAETVQPSSEPGYSFLDAISSDGRIVTFSSRADNLVVPDHNQDTDIFVRNLKQGRTILVSRTPAGQSGGGRSFRAKISGDGMRVVFVSGANDLVEDDNYSGYDIFLFDRESDEMSLVSVNSEGVQADSGSSIPGISADGNWVTFGSNGSNLVENDTNNDQDVFLRGPLN